MIEEPDDDRDAESHHRRVNGRPVYISWKWTLTTMQELYRCRVGGTVCHPPLHGSLWERVSGGRGWGWEVSWISGKLKAQGNAPTRREARQQAETALVELAKAYLKSIATAAG